MPPVLLFFGGSTGIWIQDLSFLLGRHSYCLNHSASLFLMMNFFEIRYHELFAQAGFKLWSSWSLPPRSWDYRHEPLVPGFSLLLIGSCTFARAILRQWYSHLCFLSSWDYRCEQPHSATYILKNTSLFFFESMSKPGFLAILHQINHIFELQRLLLMSLLLFWYVFGYLWVVGIGYMVLLLRKELPKMRFYTV
jgi:hypothetical protein